MGDVPLIYMMESRFCNSTKNGFCNRTKYGRDKRNLIFKFSYFGKILAEIYTEFSDCIEMEKKIVEFDKSHPRFKRTELKLRIYRTLMEENQRRSKLPYQKQMEVRFQPLIPWEDQYKYPVSEATFDQIMNEAKKIAQEELESFFYSSLIRF